jgi:CRP-like cAMP-binding protein
VDIIYKPYDSPPITITSVRAGDIFGWSAIAGNTVYTSSAACEVTCKTMRIRGEDLRTLVAEHPDAGKLLLDRLAESVSNRWQNAQVQVREILSLGVSNTL